MSGLASHRVKRFKFCLLKMKINLVYLFIHTVNCMHVPNEKIIVPFNHVEDFGHVMTVCAKNKQLLPAESDG